MLRRRFRLVRTLAWIGAVVPLLTMVAANRDNVVQAQRLETVGVSIRSNGATRQVRTAQTTVGATLKSAGVKLGALDKVSPSIEEKTRDGMTITIVNVREAVETQRQPTAYGAVRRFTKSLRPGVVQLEQEGERGEKIVRYLVKYEDGKPVSRTVVGVEVLKEPKDKIIAVGSRGDLASRGTYRTRQVKKMLATAYDPGPKSCGKWATGRTATGMKAGFGVVAVDPKVIPLGTQLYIEGYGHAVAGDRGGAIVGNRIDLGYDTYAEAIRFGRKWVTVHVLQN